ncbi:hypothetical protein L211DRAFT_864173 [Terfezia boudieri ATCC MYA-4762]|uniref:Uncharacterized protein n=1 Tax=Terfezia boudieri ATCC MYA-4762 TaxID=1051890 RepID=A0A3N4M2Z8_9PEZI|nr:hypothetical protein L211DRAFT_864173 [Terfezia boudieri ATCC MYA-4762]
MENPESQSVSADSSNNEQLEFTPQEVALLIAKCINRSTHSLDSLAQALIQVHNFAERLVIAEHIVAECIMEYAVIVDQRIRYRTLIDENAICSDETTVERAIAASKVWKARAALDQNLAYNADLEGRALLRLIRSFQARNLQTPEFQHSLRSEETEFESQTTATKKLLEVFHRLKKASIASIRRCITNICVNNDAAERKASSSLTFESPASLAAVAKVAKAIEDAAVSRAIGGLTERIFLPIKDIILQGNVAKDVDKCQQKHVSDGKQLGDGDGITKGNPIISSGLESHNRPLDPVEICDVSHHEVINEATQNSMSAATTNADDGYSLGDYYGSNNIGEVTEHTKGSE